MSKKFKATRPVEYYEPFAGFSIAGHYYPDKTSPDGKRFVATEAGWKLLTAAGRDEIGWCQAEKCHRLHAGTEFHHVFGRGAGKRQDRVSVGDTVYLIWAARECHEEMKIQRRLPVRQEN